MVLDFESSLNDVRQLRIPLLSFEIDHGPLYSFLDRRAEVVIVAADPVFRDRIPARVTKLTRVRCLGTISSRRQKLIQVATSHGSAPDGSSHILGKQRIALCQVHGIGIYSVRRRVVLHRDSLKGSA